MKKFFISYVVGYKNISKKIWVLSAATFIEAIGTSMIFYLSVFLYEKLHISISGIGYIASAAGIGGAVGAYFGGTIVKAFAGYKILICSLLINSLFTFFIPFTFNILLLSIEIMLIGIISGIFKTANTLMILSDVNQIDRPKTNGLYRVAVNLGMGIATGIGGLLILIGYEYIFIADACAMLSSAMLLWLFRSSLISNQKISEYKKLPSINSFLENPLKDKLFLLFCLILFLNCLVFFQIRSTYPIYLTDNYHIDTAFLGFLFFINCLMVVLLEVPLLNSLKRINQLYIVSLGTIFLCFGMFILVFGSSHVLAILSCLFFTLGEILFFPTLIALVMDKLNEKNQEKGIGVYQATFPIAGILAPLVGGGLYNLLQGKIIWYSCGLIGVLCVLILLCINMYNTLINCFEVSAYMLRVFKRLMVVVQKVTKIFYWNYLR